MSINHDFSDFPEQLRNFGLDQILWQEVLVYDAATNTIMESVEATSLQRELVNFDQYGSWNWWLRFGVGFECLLKALFLKHQIPIIKKKELLRKATRGSAPLRTPAAAKVYEALSIFNLSATRNAWLQIQFQQLQITHPQEINLQTLGFCQRQLSTLTSMGVITTPQEVFLEDAITVLADIRRNVDAHTFLKVQTAGSINNDLSDVYVPAINIMLHAF